MVSRAFIEAAVTGITMPRSTFPLRKANRLLSRLDWHNPVHLMDALALLHDLASQTPIRILQDYDGFAEDMLADGAADRAARFVRGEVTLTQDSSDEDLLLDASRWLRTLEQAALEHGRFLVGDGEGDLEDAWRTTDGRHYVIPRITPLRGADDRNFSKRALLYHRIVPAVIDTMAVRLHRVASAADTATVAREKLSRQRAYGAGFFPGLDVSIVHPGPRTFLVDGVSGFNARALIEDHIREARGKACVAVVWAELTMPDAHVEILQSVLAESALDSLSAPRFLVAGSWHRPAGKKVRNICRVLDGHGEALFDVAKWAKFKFGGFTEAIEAGGELPLLVDEDHLSVIAICRDFLDRRAAAIPYGQLHVDVAIVPSMTPVITDLKTVQGHAATAQEMRIRFDTRTLVVAQPATADKAAGAAVGQVLAFPEDPPAAANGEYVAGPWRICLLNPH